MILWVLGYGLLGLIGGYIAAHKGYAPKWGILAGIFIGPIALIVAACLPKTKEARERTELEIKTKLELAYTSQTQPCPRCGRENSVATRICPQCEFRF
jgi:hypothetical protein